MLRDFNTFMLTIKYETTFKKDFKRILKRGYDIRLFEEVVGILANSRNSPIKYKDHNLIGDYKDCRECHIIPDWLLIYRVDGMNLFCILNEPAPTAICFNTT